MRVNNQLGVMTGMGAGAASGESVRTDEMIAGLGGKADKAGATFTGPALVSDYQGGIIAAGATVNPDVTPGSGKQCFSYSVGANCTLGALAGTAGMAAGTAVAGSIYLTFTAPATVTIATSYKLPQSALYSVTGVAGETCRVDFQYRRSADRCSASLVKETA